MGFNQQALLNLMSHPNEISEREVAELTEMIENYPYFQLGYSLLAKAKHDSQAADAYKYLSKAAIYAPNRRMLRKLFYEDLHIDYFSPLSSTKVEEDIEEKSVQDINTTLADENSFSTPEVYNPLEVEENTLAQDQDEEVIQSDEVYNELEENLRKLRESKNKFSEEEEENKKKIAEESEAENDQDNYPSALLDKPDNQTAIPTPLDSNKQKQNELIDKFINSQDTISFKSKVVADADEESEDLSHKSTEMADNVVSENLAEIYLRQGKKDKAIEIYQKLIWKFPQKKAYFADKIESLKAE